MIPIWTLAGCRVVAPDLIGFGQSDKPKRADAHSFDFHRNILLELIEHLDLQGVVLVVQDWGGILGLTLPMEHPERYQGLLAMNTLLATGEQPLSKGFLEWRAMCAQKPGYDVARLFARGNPHLTAAECEAYNAPFPDAGHRAALRAFPAMVPEQATDAGAATSRKAATFWRESWQGKSLLAVGAQDPVLQQLQHTIRNCPQPMVIAEAGHFVQEHGASIAEAALHIWPAG
jgi:tRNA(adenine34) deaminase